MSLEEQPFYRYLNGSVCTQWQNHHRRLCNDYWPITISSLIISLSNIVTNLIAFFVFYRDPVDSILTKLLLALSLFEVIFQQFFVVHLLVDYYFLLSSRLQFHSFTGLNIFIKSYLWLVIPGITASHMARNWMVVMISFFRFEVLIRTFSVRWILFRKTRILRICLVIVLLSIIASLPRTADRNVFYCEQTVEEDPPDASDSSVYVIVGLGLSKYQYQALYLYGYNVIALFLLQTGGPTFLVCFASIAILLKLRERSLIRLRLAQKTPQQRLLQKQKQRHQIKSIRSDDDMDNTDCETIDKLTPLKQRGRLNLRNMFTKKTKNLDPNVESSLNNRAKNDTEYDLILEDDSGKGGDDDNEEGSVNSYSDALMAEQLSTMQVEGTNHFVETSYNQPIIGEAEASNDNMTCRYGLSQGCEEDQIVPLSAVEKGSESTASPATVVTTTTPCSQKNANCSSSISHNSHSNNKGSGGRLIIILCIIFCICEMPVFFSKLLNGIYILLKSKTGPSFIYMGIVANFATAIDSFANIFIYLLSNRRFRSQVFNLFRKPQ